MCVSSSRGMTSTLCRPTRTAKSTGRSPPMGVPYLVVKHDYHDYADEPRPADDTTDEAALTSSNAPFPLKLYFMLEDVHVKGMTHIVSWQIHGRCFIVHKADEFKALLPKYFKLSKIASFQRQLNLYGFSRLTRGVDRGSYYNCLFLRGKPFLLGRMQRIKVKGTGVRARSNPEHEPDFWSMKPVGCSGGIDHQTCASTPDAIVSAHHHKTAAASSASVVSEEEDDEPPQLQHVPSGKMVRRFSASNGAMPLSAWGMPFMYLAPAHQDKMEPANMSMEDISDEVYLDQSLMDILRETDAMFPDMLDTVVSV